MAEITLTVTNRAITLPQTVPQQIAETEYIDKVKFNCDSEYNGYTLVAVFKNGEHGKTYPVTVPADRSAVDIDPRALRRAGLLYIGMFGVNGLKTLPTLWAPAIEIKDGTDVGADADTEEKPAIVARVEALETAVDSLEDTVDDLGDTVEALAEEVVTLDNAVDELTDTVEGLADDVEELTETVEGKQDTITDLDTIRSGAAAGATALQSVPMASVNALGGVKAYPQAGWDGYGVKINGSGFIYVARAKDNAIEQRINEYNPIVPKNIDKAVSAALCSPIREYTDEEKAAACATIGAEYSRPWAKLCEHTFETQTNDPYVIETYGQHKTFVYVLKCPNGNSGSIYNNMHAVFDDGEQVVCETSTLAEGASYVYGMIDFENISIYTGIRATNAVNTMNLYGAAYTAQITMFDELMRSGYINNIYLAGTKPAGMELIVFAR